MSEANTSTNGSRPGAPGGAASSGETNGLELEALGGTQGQGSTSPKMLVPLFVVPLLIVVVIVAIFYVVGRVVSHEKTIPELIQDVQSGGVNVRWQAAAHLSEIAIKEPAKLADPQLRAQLRNVFQNAGADDTRLRRYLAELWGEIGDVEAAPIMVDAVARLNGMLAQPGTRASELGDAVTGELIYYLSSLGRLGIDSSEPSLLSCVKDEDAGVRKAAASALGDFGRRQILAHKQPDDALVNALLALHGDDDAWVQMNAAVALAKIDRADGVATLEAMLRREWLKARKLRFPDDGHYTVGRDDPAAVVVTSALLSIEHLVDAGVIARGAATDSTLRQALEAAASDPNPKAQECARTVLNKLGK